MGNNNKNKNNYQLLSLYYYSFNMLFKSTLIITALLATVANAAILDTDSSVVGASVDNQERELKKNKSNKSGKKDKKEKKSKDKKGKSSKNDVVVTESPTTAP